MQWCKADISNSRVKRRLLKFLGVLSLDARPSCCPPHKIHAENQHSDNEALEALAEAAPPRGQRMDFMQLTLMLQP